MLPSVVTLDKLMAICVVWDGERIYYFNGVLSCERKCTKTFGKKLVSHRAFKYKYIGHTSVRKKGFTGIFYTEIK